MQTNKKDQIIQKLENKISRLESSVDQLKVLNQIAVSSGKAADIDQVLNLIVEKSIDAIKAEQGSILLVTKDKDKPAKTLVRQDDTSRLQHNYHIGTNISGWVLENKEPLIIENLAEDKRFIPTEDEKKDIKSILCVPIWFEGEIIGLMMLINKKYKKQFSKDDLTLFTIISVQAGQLIKNLELQRESFQKRKESEKLQELDRIKTNFFTNISHEFRTPLTLILGPAKRISEKTNDKIIKDDAGIILRNAEKLNILANQILDLSRIEAGQMKLKTSPYDLILVASIIVSSFQYLAEMKKISLRLNSNSEKLILFLDRDKIEKILSNLLSNAIKFTQEYGSINVDIKTKGFPKSKENKDEFVEILVSDTGIGIPEDQVNNIFNRYYRVESNSPYGYEGAGIGLSLTKELVELHKGKITVASNKGKGTTFKILLPFGKKHLSPKETSNEKLVEENYYSNNLLFNKLQDLYFQSTPDQQKSDFGQKIKSVEIYEGTSKKGKPLLLLVEDNGDVRRYIIEILDEYYQIDQASDGVVGLTRALEKIPDLIISDIMMPKMDGIRLCSKLKLDTRTSHIPLILLTAKNAPSDKLVGLETGADDYIMKPFEPSELKMRIKNLLEQRERIHKHFQKLGFFIDDATITSLDQKLLNHTISTINKYISDENFSVKKLAEDIAVSRSLLHKKLVSLIGESPSDLIKRLRLNKAAKLIQQKSGNISEIAYEVGFTSPSYFAKCFQKQFGLGPSQYQTNFNNS